MEMFETALAEEWAAFVRHVPRLTMALVVVAVAWLLGRAASVIVARMVARRARALAHVGFFRRLVVLGFVGIGAAIALGMVGLEGVAAGLLTSGGLVAVVAAFAFRQIGENFLSGLFLAFSCPFEVGNHIASGDFEGEVKSVELRYTHVRTFDGRDVYIPNAQIFNQPLVNYTRDGLRRFDCRIGIDYADDAARALELIGRQVEQVQGVLDEPRPTARLRELASQTVELSALYWVDVFKAERSVLAIQTECNDRVRRTLMGSGFTVSSNVSTAVDLRAPAPIAFTQAAVSGAGRGDTA